MLLWLTGRRRRRGWRGKGEEVPCKLQILPADYHRRVGTRCDFFFFLNSARGVTWREQSPFRRVRTQRLPGCGQSCL